MLFRSLIPVLAGFFIPPEGIQIPDIEIVEPAEIVVTARREPPQDRPDAVAVLRDLCFDPQRRSGSSTEPETEPETASPWVPLDENERRRFQITQASTSAYSLYDPSRDQELWLKIETHEREVPLVEHRCTVLAIGGSDHARFIADMSELFRGAPTQRHIGVPAGTPHLPDWEQWLWTGMPQRGSPSWQSSPRPRGSAGQSFIVVTDPALFYRAHDYIYGDLKIRDGEIPLSLLSFGVVRRWRED